MSFKSIIKNLSVNETDFQKQMINKNYIFEISKSKNFESIVWLSILFILLVFMVFVGGLTRLTDSGLSIIEWKPILGSIPPLNEKKWLVEFEKYKTTPEFIIQNFNISMNEFKFIYWWEWGHRQLGRLIGLVWFLGFLYLFFLKKIPVGWKKKFIFLGALGGLQGFLGWWMVSSGLKGTMVDVASYRLAIHLTVAFIILSVIIWYILVLSNSEVIRNSSEVKRDFKLIFLVNMILFAIFFQIVFGALVAGIDAGKTFNDWPLMSGKWFPEDITYSNPKIISFIDDAGLVQFNHRILGYFIFILSLIVWFFSVKSNNKKIIVRANYFLIVIIGQVALGVITIIYSAPLYLASAHQILAILLVTLTLRLYFTIIYPLKN